MHLAWRWFTGLGFDQEIPHRSTFSKNRHGRYKSQLPVLADPEPRSAKGGRRPHNLESVEKKLGNTVKRLEEGEEVQTDIHRPSS